MGYHAAHNTTLEKKQEKLLRIFASLDNHLQPDIQHLDAVMQP